MPEIPPEKVFDVQNDTCGKYWTPRTQKNPLIHDYELTYKADATGRVVAEYRYLPRLRLPVYCQFCQEMLDVLDGGEALTADNVDAAKLRSFTAYLGPDFLEGSILCIT